MPVNGMRGTMLGTVLAIALVAGCSSDGPDGTGDPAGPGDGTVSTPETPETPGTPESTAPTVTATTLPPAEPLAIASVTWNEGRFELADGAVSEDWGVVAGPTEGGPYPVALVLHGSHSACPADTGEGRTWPCPDGTERPHQEGLTYLAEALAARGFVAVAPGTNVQHTFGSGEPLPAVRTAEIADRAVTALLAGELGVDAALADAERLVVIGHSVGGQEATMLAAGVTTFGYEVDGIVMLQPALNSTDALPLADVPVVIVLSGCDGDTRVVGGQYVTEALLEVREAPAALVLVEHANHNSTNTGLQPDAFPVETPGCTPERVMPAVDQQALLAEVVPEFAHAVVADGAGTGWAGAIFDSPEPPTGVQLDVVRAGQPIPVVPGLGPDVPAAVADDGLDLTFCPIGYYTPFVEPGTEACHRPELSHMVGVPQSIAASWTEPGASLTVTVEAAPGDTLVLRAFADPADQVLNDGEVAVRVTTPEGLDATWALPVPELERELGGVFDLTHALVMWSTLSLVVPDGASAVTLTVMSPDAGSLQIVSVGVEH